MSTNLESNITSVCSAWKLLADASLEKRSDPRWCKTIPLERLAAMAASSGLDKALISCFVEAVIAHPQSRYISDKQGVSIRGAVLDPAYLLTSVFPGVLDPQLADAWFLASLRRTEEVRGTPRAWSMVRAACRSLNESPGAEQHCAINELRKRLGSACGSSKDAKRLARCLLYFLLAHRSVVPSPDMCQGVYLRGVLNSDYITNVLFSFGLSVRGLNFLLEGGARFSDAHGLSILLRGSPGCGKSTLALQCAADAASLGGFVFYLTTEHETDRLAELVLQYRLGAPGLYSVIMASEVDIAHRADSVKGLPGVILFSKIPRSSFAHAENAVRECVGGAWGAGDRRRLVVVDSLSSIWGYSGDMRAARQKIHSFCRSYTRGGSGLLLVEEVEGRAIQERASYEEYVADMVVDIGARSISPDDSQLCVSILKSRYQRQLRGSHFADISAEGRERGFRVYPSPSAVISARRGRRRSRPGTVLVPPIRDFNEHLYGTPSHKRGLTNGISANSLVAITGPPGSHKGTLAYCLACSTNDTIGPATIAFVSFRESADQQWQLPSASPCLLAIRQECENRGIALQSGGNLSFYPGLLSPGVMLDRMVSAMKSAKDCGRPITRLVIDDLGLIPTQYPEISRSTLWLPALLQILRTEACTTFCVFSVPESPRPETLSLLSHIESESDHVLRTCIVPVRGRQRVGVTLLKSPTPERQKRCSELCVRSESVEMSDGLDAYQVDTTGALTPIPVIVHLPFETDMQERYARAVESDLRECVIQSVEVRPVTDSLGHSGSLPRDSGPLPSLRVCALDEFWVEQFRRRESTQLASLFPEATLSMAPPAFCRPQMIGQDGAVVAMPYYLNFGVLCYRCDIVEEAPLGWDQIADTGLDLLGSGKHADVDRILSIPTFLRENLNCVFLEILACKGALRNQRCLQAALHEATTIDACLLLSRLFRISPAVGINSKSLEDPDDTIFTKQSRYAKSSPRAIYWRQWLSTVNQLYVDYPDLRGRVAMCALPSGISVSGEWYLSILGESMAQTTGVRIIEELTSEYQVRERMRLGIGLSPDSRLYAGKGRVPFGIESLGCDDVSRLCSQCIHRSHFKCYQRLSPILATYLSSIRQVAWRIRSEDRMRREVTELATNMIESLHAVRESVCESCAGRTE